MQHGPAEQQSPQREQHQANERNVIAKTLVHENNNTSAPVVPALDCLVDGKFQRVERLLRLLL
jgi:hypothetical protein